MRPRGSHPYDKRNALFLECRRAKFGSNINLRGRPPPTILRRRCTSPRQVAGIRACCEHAPSLVAASAAGVLKGASPGTLPIEHSTKFNIIVNFQTAKALGLALPSSLLVRADEVIE